MIRDVWPQYPLRAASTIGGTTHVAAPGPGLRVVVMEAMFGAGGTDVEIRDGATAIDKVKGGLGTTPFFHNPYGWWVLTENSALTTNLNISSTLQYKVVPA